jgi:NAD(P)-dependent dehydrogenase (short-subunit alcohol dehydrogenase family)
MDKPTLIITGASRGIGAAAARCALEYGANLVLTARSLPALQEITQRLTSVGGEVISIAGDLGVEADCQAIVEVAGARFGRIDGLINNGGILEPIAPVSRATFAEWDRNYQVNVLGPVMLTCFALPYLRQSQGRVINVSTGASVKVTPGWAAYSVAKAALNHYTSILAVDEPAVTALAVRPGKVDTDMQAFIRRTGLSGMPPDLHRKFIDFYERGQLLPPEKVGRAIAWMALYAPHEWSGEFIEWNDPRLPEEIR